MNVDPLASMRCWEVTVELAGREYTLPARPAVDWWPLLTSASVSDFLDMFESTEELEALMVSGDLGAGELESTFQDVVTEVTGRSFRAAVGLAYSATEAWPMVGGELARRGFRWDVLPIGAALDAVYATIMAALDTESQEKFLAALEPEKATQETKAKAVQSFEELAGPRPTGGVRSTAGPSGGPLPRSRTRSQRPPQAAP